MPFYYVLHCSTECTKCRAMNVLFQVGCALRCTFCATGKGGLGRNLKSHEIVDQVFCLFVLLVFSLSIELAFNNLVEIRRFSDI